MKRILIKDKAILMYDKEVIEVSECTVFTDDDTVIIYPDNKDYALYQEKIAEHDKSQQNV